MIGKIKTIFLVFGVFGTLVFASSGELDKEKYITIDEVKPGMEAYCLTCYKGTEVEKFEMEVLDVVRGIRPGRDAILVKGKDPRFIHTGPVHGCSGSPVYIDDRMAGALSFGWSFSKDPFYGVTPIKDMLVVGGESKPDSSGGRMGFSFDFSKPLDFVQIEQQMKAELKSREKIGGNSLLCPLVTSGLPTEVCEQLDSLVRPLGFMAVNGLSADSKIAGGEKAELTSGATLAVPIVSGDMTLAAIGTVTEVVDDKVYGFGHSFLGYGPIDLPMATGKIHTVFAGVASSFKVGSPLDIVGALKADESTAVYGEIGVKARMIPLKIQVERYNDPQRRVYDCQVADNQVLTPSVLPSALAGAILMRGDLPPDNVIEYKAAIEIEGFETIRFENLSTIVGLNEFLTESMGSVGIVMNNPYEKVKIKSMDFKIKVLPKNIVAHIWSVNLSDSKIKAGEEIHFNVVIESVREEKKEYQLNLSLPENLKPGKYKLYVGGESEYKNFIVKTKPYKLVPENMATLIEAVNDILNIRRDTLYCYLVLPPGGIAIERAELPDLPGTKMLVLQDSKRALDKRPYLNWIEKRVKTGTVIIDQKVMDIIVER